MTQKERLVELLRKEYGSDVWLGATKCGVYGAQTKITGIETVADYLLSNGVIVPPCKAGDRVWFHICPENGFLSTAKGEVTAIVERDGHGFLEICSYNIILGRTFDEVFLTYEEAEQALKERET